MAGACGQAGEGEAWRVRAGRRAAPPGPAAAGWGWGSGCASWYLGPRVWLCATARSKIYWKIELKSPKFSSRGSAPHPAGLPPWTQGFHPIRCFCCTFSDPESGTCFKVTLGNVCKAGYAAPVKSSRVDLV